MKRVVNVVLAAVLLGGLLLASQQAARAEVKPLAVVSVASYDEVLADLEFLGQLSDRPNPLKGVGVVLKIALANKEALGIDTSRPWGILVGTDGEAVGHCGFLPVTNLDQVIELFKPILEKVSRVSRRGKVPLHAQINECRRPLISDPS